MSAEYQEHFGEHAYDEEGNYIGGDSSEAQEAWAEYYAEHPEALEAGTEASGGADLAVADDIEANVLADELVVEVVEVSAEEAPEA